MFKKPGDPPKTADGKDRSQQSSVTHGNPFAITASAVPAPAFSFGTSSTTTGTFGVPTTSFGQSTFGNASKLSFGSKWECPASTAPVFNFAAGSSSGTTHGDFGLQSPLFSGKEDQPGSAAFGARPEHVFATKAEPQQTIPLGAKQEQETGLLKGSAGTLAFRPAGKAPTSTVFAAVPTGSAPVVGTEHPQVAFGSTAEPGLVPQHQNQPFKLFVSNTTEKQQLFENVIQSSTPSGMQSHQASVQAVPASFASIAISQPILHVSSPSSPSQSAASGSAVVFGQTTAFGNQPDVVNQPHKAAQVSLFGTGQGVAEKTRDTPAVAPLFSGGQISLSAGQDPVDVKPAVTFSFVSSQQQQQAPSKPSMFSNLHNVPTVSSAGTVIPLASSKAAVIQQQPQLVPAKTVESITAFGTTKTSTGAGFFSKTFDKQVSTTQLAILGGRGLQKQQVARSLFGSSQPVTESLIDASKKSTSPFEPGGFVFGISRVKEPSSDSHKGASSFSFVTQTKQDDRAPSLVQQPREKNQVPQFDSAGGGLVQELLGKPETPTDTKSTSQVLAGGDSKREGRKLSSDGNTGIKVTATAEEISMLTTLLCSQLPAELNDREVLLEHFGQFGCVERINCNLKRKCATIRFHDHHSAELAKKRGAQISPQFPPLEIFWCSKRRPSAEGRGESRGKPRSSSDTTFDEDSASGHGLAEVCTLEQPTERAQAPPAAEQRPARRLRSQLGHKGTRRTRAAAMGSRASKGGESVEELAAKVEAGESLSSWLKQAAHSVGERYRVLDARDKIIRLRVEKQSDLATARATKGCCPDMCPEKERYSRTEKECLSSFEMLPGSDGVMDHTRMVKEYSRSSADQEEPLAHELRPPHVLRHTMDYLIVHLMDYSALATDGGTVPPVGEWYDFIWNRTRSIRKDITQQHLCDETCVTLVEQCARFHIHCAAALCEEDISAFDPKINDENLVKCLQTLKHFYYDLSLKGLRCPNEPEFRAYDALLHLNQGDTIRQVQKLPDWVRWSPQVKQAVAAFGAFNSNNYVRFFRLAAEVPYLAACLMHRYFGQVRVRALQTFLKAFCQSHQKEEFSLEILGKHLGFDSVSEVQQFASALGLRTSDHALLLDRSSQVQMESGTLPVWRSKSLVNAKCTTSTGQVVSGGSLPQDPQEKYQPHDSFTVDGMLRPSAFDASDQVSKCWGERKPTVATVPVATEAAPEVHSGGQDDRQARWEHPLQEEHVLPTPTQSIVPATIAMVYPEETIEEVVDAMVEEVVQVHVAAMGRTVMLAQVAELTTDALMEEEVQHLSEVACQEEYLHAEEQRLQEKLLAKQQAREDERRAQELLAAEVLYEGLNEEAADLCRECHWEGLEEWRTEQGSLVLATQLEDVVREEVAGAARDSIAEDWALHEAQARRAEEFHCRRLLASCFAYWVEFCEREKRQRRARETFPAAPSMLCTLTNPAFKLLPPPEKRPRLSGATRDWQCISRGLDAGVLIIALTDKLERAPLDLEWLLAPLEHHQQSAESQEEGQKFPFKLVVCLPPTDCVHSYEAQLTIDRVRSKLGCLRQLPRADAKVETIASPEGSAAPFCLTVVHGDFSSLGWDSNERPRLLSGTSALLVVTTDEPRERLEQRLKETLAAASRLRPVPCVCVVDLCSSGNQDVIKAALEDCNHRGTLPEVHMVMSYGRDAPPRRVLEDAVRWCSQARVIPPLLQTSPLRSFVSSGVYRLVFDIIENDLPNHESRWQLPNDIIQLYNCALDHLAAVAASDKLSELTVVAPEIKHPRFESDWNDRQHLRALHHKVLSLQFPEVHGDTRHVNAVHDYILQLFSKHMCSATQRASMLARVSIMLKQRGESGAYLSCATCWVDVLQQCFCHLLFSSSSFRNEETGEELVVHYLLDQVDQFDAWGTWVGITLRSCPPYLAMNESSGSEEEEGGPGELSPVPLPIDEAPLADMATQDAVLASDQPTKMQDSPDLRCLREFELLLARQKELSTSFSSELRAALTVHNPKSSSEQGQEENKENLPNHAPTSSQSVEDILAMLEARVQENRKSSAMFTTFAATVLKS